MYYNIINKKNIYNIKYLFYHNQNEGQNSGISLR